LLNNNRLLDVIKNLWNGRVHSSCLSVGMHPFCLF